MPYDRDTDFIINRNVIPDLYPRKDDPFKPGAGGIPSLAPPGSLLGENEIAPSPFDIYNGVITPPGTRPVVYQRAVNFQVTATTAAVPLTAQQFQCDSIVISVASTAANNVFIGYGAGVTTTSGIEVVRGVPVNILPDNSREMWELQRVLEGIMAILSYQANVSPLPTYKAPRVVMDSHDWYVIATANTTVGVMLFTVPEYQ